MEQSYLIKVVRPFITELAPLWLSSLTEYARLKFEPDISVNSGMIASVSGVSDSVYAALNRQILLRV